jgi:mannose-6-phosphate isomerase-like protein (cupin superfamily)
MEVFRQLKTRDVGRLRDQLNKLAKRANEQLGSFDAATIGIGRYVPGSSPWERHRNGDELLLVTDGEVQIEILDDDGTSHVEQLKEGTLFVVPRGLWHQLTASANVNILYISPSEDGAERMKERP